jgi:hypothetical protein
MNVTDEKTVIVDNVLSARTVLVKNTGSDTVTLSKDPTLTAGVGFDIAAGASVTLDLSPGQALYGICAADDTSTVQTL